MTLDIFFTPAALAGVEMAPRIVVIDVLRATSSILEALHNGARAVFPVATTDDAVRLAQNLGRDEVILCGERQGLPIEGFDLGNSPFEYGPDTVEDKALVMSTTNGTAAFVTVADRLPSKPAGSPHGADTAKSRIYTGAFLNLGAVVEHLLQDSSPVYIVCAGRIGGFSLEDALCAGKMALRLQERLEEGLELNDAAAAALELARRYRQALPKVLRMTAAGRRLIEIGREEDIDFCAQVDRYEHVPELKDRKISI